MQDHYQSEGTASNAEQSSSLDGCEVVIPYQDRRPAIKSLVVLGPSWFSPGTRVKAWARDFAEIGSLSVVVQFPGDDQPVTTPRRINIDEQVNALLQGARIAREVANDRGFPLTKVFYGGSSGGLTAALYATTQDPDVSGVFGMSPFTHKDAYRPLQRPGVRDALAGAAARKLTVSLAAFDQRSKDAQLDVAASLPSINLINLASIAPRIQVPVRIAYGLQDEIVDPASICAFADQLSASIKNDALIALDGKHELAQYDAELPRRFAEFIQRTTQHRDVA